MYLDFIFFLTLFMSGFFSAILLGIDSKDSSQVIGELSDMARQSQRAQLWKNLTAQGRIGLGIVAVVLFTAALGVNICTWFSAGIVRHRNPLIALDIGMGILLFAWVVLERWRWRMFGPKEWAFIFPRWSKTVFAALLIYIAFEFAFDTSRLYRQQRLSARPNGTIKLEMTAEDQTQKQIRTVRAFSSIWILISSVSATGLLLIKYEPYEGPFGKFNRVVQQL